MGIVKPKKPVNGYRWFVRDMIKAVNHDLSISREKFSEACEKAWAVLPPNKRDKYHQKSVKDQTRYYNQLKKYDEIRKMCGPPKPCNTFIWFCRINTSKLKDANPTWGAIRLTKKLARMWRSVPAEEKVRYGRIAQRDKIKYLEKKAAFEE